MRVKRTIKPMIIKEYNELAKAINNKTLAIFIVGEAYEELKKDIMKKHKKGKTNRRTGKANLVIGIGITFFTAIPVVGQVFLGLGALNYLCGKLGDDFRNYQVNNNENEKRIELLRIKGENAVDLKYDTIEGM